jgi:carbamoyltransferase
MFILGIHVGRHDSAACLFKDDELVAFCKEERLTREKNCGKKFKLLSIDEVLRIAGITRKDIDAAALSRYHIPAVCYRRRDRFFVEKFREIRGKESNRKLFREMTTQHEYDEKKLINEDALRKFLNVRNDTEIFFTNHHYAHILGLLKWTTWPDEALFVSCDGGGDYAYYTAYYLKDNKLECLCGADLPTFDKPQNEGASIGLAYCSITELLGFRPNRHEGKITGLAAFGKPVAGEQIRAFFKINANDSTIDSDIKSRWELQAELKKISDKLSREDMAASIQYATEKVGVDWVKTLLARRPAKYIGMSGGVFSNVLLNQRVSEIPGIKETFVFPAMTDDGLPVGNCLAYLISKNGIASLNRSYLKDVYYGYPYTPQNLVDAARKQNFAVREDLKIDSSCAILLQKHAVGAIFAGRMEMGPRALGARTILANPSRRGINDSLNQRLERTEFMPFAPYVLDVDAEEVFDINDANRIPCRFMTITVNVREKYHDVIPAVVHVDGTARPQIAYREDNPLYYDILSEFKKLTKIPCLVNTSFNVHEEPIINTPEEALKALKDNRIDFLVCEKAIIARNSEFFALLE